MKSRKVALCADAPAQGWVCFGVFMLCVLVGLGTPISVRAGVQLTQFGVGTSGPGNASGPTNVETTHTPATPPAIYNEPFPSPDSYSDSVGATPATYRTDESGAATYSVPIYVPAGTAGLVPALSLEYNNRGSNGPIGPGWALGGLSAISRCKKATEFGDGVGPFPAINFDGVDADQAYCLDGARLLDLGAGAGGCPAGQSGDSAHAFGLELDPSTRVCGYTKTGIAGYAYWLVQPKDGSDRVYGVGGNSALVRNDGAGNADATQYFSWALSRIADTTGNTVELSYMQSTTTGELDISQIGYTGKIALSDVLKATPAFSRSPYANITFNYATLPAASQRIDYVAGMELALTQQLTTIVVNAPVNHGSTPNALAVARTYHLGYGTPTASGVSTLTSLQECAPGDSGEVCYPSTQFNWDYAGPHAIGFPNGPSNHSYSGLDAAIDYKVGDVDGDGRQDLVWIKDQTCDNSGSGSYRFQVMVSLANSTGFAAPIPSGVYLTRLPQSGQGVLPSCGADWRSFHFDTIWYLYDFSGDGRDDLLASSGSTWKIYPAVANGTGFAVGAC